MFKVGDQVKLTQFYLDNYPLWSPSSGTITKVLPQKKYRLIDLDKEERPLYFAKFGKLDIYTLTPMWVDFNGNKYLVCDLGVEPV